MSEYLETSPIKEFQVHLENTIIRLLIFSSLDAARDKSALMHTTHIHVCSELFVCGTGEPELYP